MTRLRWVRIRGPDTILAAITGKLQMCIGCPEGVASHYGFDRDYIWTRTP